MNQGKNPVLVCADRLVYFGWLEADADPTAKTLRISGARNCLYWHQSIGGIGGLAAVGPNDMCRIGAVVPWQIVHGVTIVRGCSAAAAAAWVAAKAVS
jgi:hypothetical protein